MRIDRLKLAEFKNFKALDVAFKPGVNLFLGLNGSGKTALLEAIAVAVGGFFGSRPQAEQRVIDFSEIRIDGKGVRQDATTVFAYWLESKQGNLEWSRTIKANTRRNDNMLVRPIKDVGEQVFKEIHTSTNHIIAPLIAYYSTQRLFKDVSQGKNQVYDPANGRKNGYIQCLEEKSIKVLLSDWLGKAVTKRATFQIKDIPQQNSILDNVEAAIKFMLVKVAEVADPDLIKIYQDPDNDNALCFRVKLNGEDVDLPLSYYSDGFRNLVFLVMDLVWRASQLNPELVFTELKQNINGIVIIDEIDLHLHQKWQTTVVTALKELFPKVQFFITTHSPTVVANFQIRDGIDALYAISKTQVVESETSYYGRDTNFIIEDFFKTPSRNAYINSRIEKFFKLLKSEYNINHLQQLEAIRNNLWIYLAPDSIEMVRMKSIIDDLVFHKSHLV